MKIVFAGFRHSHIFSLYNQAKSNNDFTIGPCWERDEQAAKVATDKLGVVFDAYSLEDILSLPEVDIVAVGDVYGDRGQIIIQALKAGKHVIADKPICTSLKELKEIERLSKEKGLKVGCMLDLRYTPMAATTRDIIHSGEIGEIKTISFTAQHCLAYGTRPHWYFEQGRHGGTINDIGIHGVDLVTYVSNLSLKNILYARQWNAFADKVPHFNDCAQFMLEMDNGAGLLADVSYSAPQFGVPLPTYWDFYFWGTEGMLNFSLTKGQVMVYKNNETATRVVDYPEREAQHLKEFYREIKGESVIIDTKQVLSSSEAVLNIQLFADKELKKN